VLVVEEQPIVGGNTVSEQLTLPGTARLLLQRARAVAVQPRDPRRRTRLAGLGLRYVHTDPAVILPFADGSSLVVHRDVERTATEIARLDEADADAFPPCTPTGRVV